MRTEEKVICGILHIRSSPQDEWQPVTLENLTTAFIALRGCYERETERVMKLEKQINAIRKSLGVRDAD